MKERTNFSVKVRGIILHESKLLAVRHPHDTSFALPGGHLEYGEDIMECLSREIIEELGVIPEIGRLLYINNFTETGGTQYIEFFFEIKNGADYLNTENLARSHAHEIAEMCWVSPSEDSRILPKTFGEDFKNGKVISNEIRYIKD